MIGREHDLPVCKQAAALGLSRSSVYSKPRPAPANDLALMRRIDELHLDYPFAGSRMLCGLLSGEGIRVGRRHVRTLMQPMGIEALYRRPRTAKPAPGHKIYPYRLCGTEVTRPNQVWAMDIAYIPMARGFVYLAVVLDWFSRRALSWRVSITLEDDFCVEALEEAPARYGKPEISARCESIVASTPARARSLRARPSPECSPVTGSRSAWTAKGLGGTMCLRSAFGAASNMKRSICGPMTA